MIYMVIGILIGLGFAIFIAFALFLEGYEPEACIITLLVVGLIFCSLGGLIGHWGDADEKINNTIKATINANYDNVVNFHNGVTNESFVSNGSKYTFDYDEETKTLTVFTDKNSNVDAVFVNGVKQDNQKTSDKTDKRKTVYHIKQMMWIRKMQTKSTASQMPTVTYLPLQSVCSRKYRTRFSPDTAVLS